MNHVMTAVLRQAPLPSRRQLATSGDILVVTAEGGIPGIQWVESRDAAKCPVMPKTVPYDK